MVPVIMGLAGLGLIGYGVKKATFGAEMTPSQEAIFNYSLHNEKDPKKIATLSTAFAAAGLDEQATILRKRSQVGQLPKAVKAMRRQVIRQALTSLDPTKVLKVADAFMQEGCVGAAETLRQYGRGLQALPGTR
jgi:hypothetical protein